MKLTVQPILQPLDLGDYHEPYRGTCLQVWVNPPREFLAERLHWMQESTRRSLEVFARQALPLPAEEEPGKKKKKSTAEAEHRPSAAQSVRELTEFDQWLAGEFATAMLDWFSRLLSQGPEATRWTIDELKAVDSADPALLEWLKRRSVEMIEAHRDGKKKS